MRLTQQKGKRCERCKDSEANLELHHKTYERLGSELDSDVELLCGACHKVADKERAEEGRKRSSDAYRKAKLDRWASRKYGEDWAERSYADSIYDEFDDRE